jgi:hypothetical protein
MPGLGRLFQHNRPNRNDHRIRNMTLANLPRRTIHISRREQMCRIARHPAGLECEWGASGWVIKQLNAVKRSGTLLPDYIDEVM